MYMNQDKGAQYEIACWTIVKRCMVSESLPRLVPRGGEASF